MLGSRDKVIDQRENPVIMRLIFSRECGQIKHVITIKNDNWMAT